LKFLLGVLDSMYYLLSSNPYKRIYPCTLLGSNHDFMQIIFPTSDSCLNRPTSVFNNPFQKFKVPPNITSFIWLVVGIEFNYMLQVFRPHTALSSHASYGARLGSIPHLYLTLLSHYFSMEYLDLPSMYFRHMLSPWTNTWQLVFTTVVDKRRS